MFISTKIDRSIQQSLVLARAEARILGYKHNASEMLLDEYLYANYGKGLKEMCVSLLKHVKISFMSSDTQEAIVRFDTHQADKLATLITYGTGKIAGSKILRSAFM